MTILKVCTILSALALFTKNVRGNQDFYHQLIGKDNLVEIAPETREFKSITTNYAFLHFALEQLNKKLNNDTIFIHVRFGNYYLKETIGLPFKPLYSLGISKTFHNVTKEDKNGFVDFTNEKRLYTTVNIFVSDSSLNITNILKLAYFGVTNVNKVKSEQRPVLIANHSDYPTPFDLGYSLVNPENIFRIEMPEIEEITHSKYYSRWISSGSNHAHRIEYFLQNNQYYLYKASTKIKPASSIRTAREVLSDTVGKVLLKLECITNILSDSSNNYFVFTSDTSMYHIQLTDTKINGPYFLKTPIYLETKSVLYPEIVVERRPDIFEFTLDTYWGSYKILFDAVSGRFSLDYLSIPRHFWTIAQERIKYQQLNDQPHSSMGDYQKRKQRIMLLGISMFLFTAFLSFYKKL